MNSKFLRSVFSWNMFYIRTPTVIFGRQIIITGDYLADNQRSGYPACFCFSL